MSSQPFGLSGTPRAGQEDTASSIASWTASSHAPNWPYRRTSAPVTWGASPRSSSPISGPPSAPGGPAHPAHPAHPALPGLPALPAYPAWALPAYPAHWSLVNGGLVHDRP